MNLFEIFQIDSSVPFVQLLLMGFKNEILDSQKRFLDSTCVCVCFYTSVNCVSLVCNCMYDPCTLSRVNPFGQDKDSMLESVNL